jgi:hypothetical protein
MQYKCKYSKSIKNMSHITAIIVTSVLAEPILRQELLNHERPRALLPEHRPRHQPIVTQPSDKINNY